MDKKELPKLENLKLAIIGLGYVGLPLAITFSEAFSKENISVEIIGFDKSQKRVNELRKRVDSTEEIASHRFNNLSNIKFTTNPQDLLNVEIFIISVPTPVDNVKKPDLSSLKNATLTVAKVLRDSEKSNHKKVIVFESTVYPGATEEVCKPIIENTLPLKLGKDFSLGYSPERINPGDKKHKLESIVKIVSASDKDTLNLLTKLYSMVAISGVHQAKSIRVAEAAKVVENIQRDINIALVNELSIIFNNLGIDSNDVMEAAATKWNFIKYQPGLVGGHCIGVDPYYLTHKSEVHGYHPEIILAGRRINDNMASWIAINSLKRFMAANSNISKKIKTIIFGITYKSNCPDIRNTKVIDIYKSLEGFGCEVEICDPLPDRDLVDEKFNIKLKKEDELDEDYNIIFIAVAHNNFKNKDNQFWRRIADSNYLIVDIKNILPKCNDVMKI